MTFRKQQEDRLETLYKNLEVEQKSKSPSNNYIKDLEFSIKQIELNLLCMPDDTGIIVLKV